MQISDKAAVSIHYTLTNSTSEQLDSSRNDGPMDYIHGSGQIIPGLENALADKVAGDKFVVTIPPAEAYGEKRDDMLQVVSKSMFGDMQEPKVGMQFHAEASHGVDVVTISKVDGDDVTIDGNHPLAGEALTFDVEIMNVRAATDDELKNQHIHGENCNHDH